ILQEERGQQDPCRAQISPFLDDRFQLLQALVIVAFPEGFERFIDLFCIFYHTERLGIRLKRDGIRAAGRSYQDHQWYDRAAQDFLLALHWRSSLSVVVMPEEGEMLC